MQSPSKYWLLPIAAILNAPVVLAQAADVPNSVERLVVTATGRPASDLEIPQLTSVITEQDLLRRAARTTPEALQESVGILVQETNLGGGSPFLRGQTGNRVLVLVDGIRLNNSTFRFGPNQYLNTVDPFTIDRVEIVRGPASVLHGSDALGGVIHVITKRRLDYASPFDADIRSTARLGSAAQEKTLRADTSANYEQFGMVAGMTFRDFADLRSGAERQDHTGYDELAGDVRLQYRIDDDHRIAFAFQRVDQDRVPRTGAFENGDEFFFDPQRRTLYALEHELEDLPWGFGTLRTTLSFQDQLEVRRRLEAAEMRTRREEDRVETIGFTSDIDHVPMQGLLLTAGVEVYHDDVSSERVDRATDTLVESEERGAFPDGTEYDTLGAYLESRIDIAELLAPVAIDVPLQLLLGGRYSRYGVESEPPGFGEVDETFDAFTGSIGATFALTSGVSLVGSIAQGFRAPNLDDTVVLKEETDLGVIDSPNPDLDPEEVVNYEAGIKIRERRLAAEAFYFYSDYDDLIERTTEGTGFDDANGNGVRDPGELSFAQRRNIGKAVIQGVEATADVHLGRGFSLAGQFSWIRGENESDDEPVRRIPPILGRGGVLYESPELPYWIEFFARVAGRQDRLSSGDRSDPRICPDGGDGCDGTPGWYTLNLRGGWQPHEAIELQLALENLADERYRIHGSGIDAPGFNAVGTLTMRF